MKFNLLLQINLIIFIYVQFLQTEHNVDKKSPWFVYQDYVNYIETRPNFTFPQFLKECRNKNMLGGFSMDSSQELANYVNKIYDNLPTFWVIEFGRKAHHTECFKFNPANGKMSTEDCFMRMGFICGTLLFGATAFYKNGTDFDVDYNLVDTVCNPHSNAFDDTIELCMIHLSTEFLEQRQLRKQAKESNTTRKKSYY